MISMETGGGLCMTCNNAPTCFYRASRGPGLFCEMFDDFAMPAERAMCLGDSGSLGCSAALSPAIESSADFTGLCINCDHREVCKHARSEGGVWHCEQYE